MKKNQILALIAVIFIGSYFVISCRHEPPISACEFTYSEWSPCDTSGHQTRTFVSGPAGCVGNPPADSILRNCGGTSYTFTYDAWSTCSNGIQVRTYTSTPAGGIPPADSITRSCGGTNYTFTYGSWSSCVNGVQVRTYTSTPAGGTPPADSITRNCTVTYTFTYGSWSICIAGSQTRTYTSTPSGGTPPADSITRICGTTACTFIYGAWTTCSNGTQTRTYTSSPAGCTGTPPADSITRTCTVTCPTITVIGTPTHPTNGANGSISASANGGVSPYTYSIDGGAYGTSSTFSSLGSGAHTISAKDANGCTSSTVTVTLNCPTVTVSGTPKSPNYNCSNGSITLTAATGGVAPYTYNINGGTFGSSLTFSSLAAGTYTLIAKDSRGCQGTTQIVVAAPATVSFTNDIKPTINSYCGRSNISCHSHGNSWTTYSDIVGTSTGTTWSSNLLTFIKRVRGTSGTTGTCSVMYSSGNHDMPPSSSTAWTTFIQGVFTNWVNQGYPNN